MVYNFFFLFFGFGQIFNFPNIFCESLSLFVGETMPPRTVKRGAGLAGPKRTTRGTRGAQKAQDPPPEEVAVLVAAPPKRSRNSSDIAGKRDLFDSLPDDFVIPILCKLSPSVFA